MAGREWTEEEEDYLKNYYKSKSDKEIAEKLDRTKNAVMNRRQHLDLSKSGWNKENWSDEEIQILEDNPHLPLKELSGKLPNRDVAGIKNKKSRLGLTRDQKWDDEETELLERLYPVWTAQDVADYLERTKDQVYNKARRQGVTEDSPEDWREDEVEFLIRIGDVWPDSEIADYLGRSVNSIRTKKNRIDHDFKQRHWTEAEEEFVRDNFPGLSDSEMAEELGKSVRAVKNRRRRKLGLIRPGMLEDTIWRSWEKLCVRIGEALYTGVEVKPELENGCVPEMRVGEILIDAKKSPFTHRVEKDIENYQGYCAQLEFWCLFGYRDFDVDGVRCVSLDELRHRVMSSDLPEEQRHEFIEMLDDFGEGLDPIQGSQSKLPKSAA